MHLRKKIVMLMVSLFFIFVVVHIHRSIVNDDDPYTIYKQKYYLDGLSHWYNYSGEYSLLIVIYILYILLWYFCLFCVLESWGDQPCQCWVEKQHFRDLHHLDQCSKWLYIADIFTRPSNWCLILLASYAAWGQSQIVQSPFQFCPLAMSLSLVILSWVF
jgi:hypothetical protein